MKKYEYKIHVSLSYEGAQEAEINTLGKEGWKLVNAVTVQIHPTVYKTIFYFKREINEVLELVK